MGSKSKPQILLMILTVILLVRLIIENVSFCLTNKKQTRRFISFLSLIDHGRPFGFVAGNSWHHPWHFNDHRVHNRVLWCMDEKTSSSSHRILFPFSLFLLPLYIILDSIRDPYLSLNNPPPSTNSS